MQRVFLVPPESSASWTEAAMVFISSQNKGGCEVVCYFTSAELVAALRLVLSSVPHSRNLASAKPCKLLSNLLLGRLLTVERSQATKGPEKPQRL